jgi:hypothetical protein
MRSKSTDPEIAMEARRLSEESVTPIQLSLRIRHPTIAPEEISTALGVVPEHCFRAGDPRTGAAKDRRTSQHTQTYWLAPVTAQAWSDPIDPAFVSVVAARYSEHDLAVSEKHLREATQKLMARSAEDLLFYCLRHLNTRQAFLQRIQSDGGDVSLLLTIERDSASDFTLPVAMARSLVKLGISLEFKFES